MARINDLNAHERPPESIRQRYKKYQRSTVSEIQQDVGIIDLQALDPQDLPAGMALAQWMSGEQLRPAFQEFIPAGEGNHGDGLHTINDIPVYTHSSVSGQQP